MEQFREGVPRDAPFSFNEAARRDVADQQEILATRGVIGRLVGFSARKGSLRDWVQAVENDDMPDLRSDLGNQLAARSLRLGLRPIGAVVYKVIEVNSSFVKVSLRSIQGQDTTEISRTYGGGGHAAASSFMISKERFDDWKCKELSVANGVDSKLSCSHLQNLL